MKLLRALTIAALAVEAAALAIGGKQMTVERDSDGLQDIVTTPFFSRVDFEALLSDIYSVRERGRRSSALITNHHISIRLRGMSSH
jgi:hypothetical protein